MLLRLCFISCICIILTIDSYGQAIIKGSIIDSSDKEPIPGVTVLLKDSLNKICAYTSTDRNGLFIITKKPTAETIEFSMIGYDRQQLSLNDYKENQTIALEHSSEQLKNINVSAAQIKEQGDTVIYFVSTFAKEHDKSIGDVLKRMPGLKVEDSGKIQYQGADINRFYIEGSDLLGGRYGVATNNISASDIGAVEIMENHQPIKVLGGIAYSDQAALNLKLKKESKSTWLANGSASGGLSQHPLHGLWEGNLFTMAAKQKFQTLITLKSNNTGRELNKEISDYSHSVRNTEIGNYFTLRHPASAPFGSIRERDNVSHLLSLNQLWKLSDKYELKSQFNYSFNRDRSRSESLTTYFLDDGNKIVSELQTGHQRENTLNGSLSFISNEHSYYINNTFSINANWNRGSFATRGTSTNIQNISNSNVYLCNSFSLIRRIRSKRLIRIESLTEWENMPQTLEVQRQKSFGQQLCNHAFYNEEKSSYRFEYRGLGFTMDGGIKTYFSELTSQILSGDIPEGSFADKRNYFSVYFTPGIQKRISRIDISMKIPLYYNYYSMGGIISDKSNCLYTPSLTIRWSTQKNISASVSGSVGKSTPSLKTIYSGIIASDYRVFNYGMNFFGLISRQRIAADIHYRNTSKGLFANVTSILSWTNSPYTRYQLIEGDDAYYGYNANRSTGRMFTFTWGLSKTLRLISGGFYLDGLFTRNRNKIISQSNISLSSYDMLSVNGKLYSSPCRLLYLQYQFKLNYSALHYKYVNKSADISNIIQATIYPSSKLYFDLTGELLETGIYTDSKNFVPMIDAALTVKLSKAVELKASTTNIFNRNAYSGTYYGILSTVRTTTFIRGREFLISIYLKR